MQNPKVSIIIPSYGRPSILEDCLESVASQKYDNFEIILVHQGESHPQIEIDELRMLAFDDPIGSTEAKNRGIDAAEGELLVFIDDDIIPKSSTWLKEFVREFQQADTTVGAVGGYINEPNPFDGQDTGTIKKDVPGVFRIISNFQTDSRKTTDHLKIGNTAVKSTVFEQLAEPYFDPTYGGNAHREETDFFLRVRKAGFKLLYTPECAVDHLHADTGGQRLAVNNQALKSAWWAGRNEAILYRRYFSGGVLTTIKFVIQEILFNRHYPLKHISKIVGVIWGVLSTTGNNNKVSTPPEDRVKL